MRFPDQLVVVQNSVCVRKLSKESPSHNRDIVDWIYSLKYLAGAGMLFLGGWNEVYRKQFPSYSCANVGHTRL